MTTALTLAAIVAGAILILGGIAQLMIEYDPAGWRPLIIGVLLAATGALTHWP